MVRRGRMFSHLAYGSGMHRSTAKPESTAQIGRSCPRRAGGGSPRALVSVLRGFECFAEPLGAAPRCDHAALRLSLRAPGAAKHSHPAPISQLLGLFDPAARSLTR